jgi:hypothetical protein
MSVKRPLTINYTRQVDCEPISLPEAKSWLQIDYSDWDGVIQDELIPAARIESEMATGLLYTEREVTISNNKRDERIYPIGPWVEDVTTDDTEIENYSYMAGFSATNPLPNDLRVAMLKRIATAFAYRQNMMDAQTYYAHKGSITEEMKYRSDLFV